MNAGQTAMYRSMQFFRTTALALGLTLALASPSFAAFGDQEQPGPEEQMLFYAPSATPETHFSHVQAVITAYRVGDKYGEIDILDGLHHPWKMLMGGDLKIEGHRVDCQDAPQPGDDVNQVVCPDWPHDIILGKTMVTLTYWQGTLDNKPIMIVAKINKTRGPFLP